MPSNLLPLSHEQLQEPWRLQNMDAPHPILPVVAFNHEGGVFYQVNTVKLDQRSTFQAWCHQPELRSAFANLLSSIELKGSMQDIEEPWSLFQELCPTWPSLVFQIRQQHSGKQSEPNSLMGWALQHANLSALKMLRNTGVSPISPVNIFAQATLNGPFAPSSRSLKEVVKIVKTLDPKDLKGSDGRLRFQVMGEHYRLSLLGWAVIKHAWPLVEHLLDQGMDLSNVHERFIPRPPGDPAEPVNHCSIVDIWKAHKHVSPESLRLYQRASVMMEQTVLLQAVRDHSEPPSTVIPDRPRL